jgi:hypothetical protein
MFRKLELFSSSAEGRVKPILLGSLEIANLNYWTWRLDSSKGSIRLGVFLSLQLERETDSAAETLCSIN